MASSSAAKASKKSGRYGRDLSFLLYPGTGVGQFIKIDGNGDFLIEHRESNSIKRHSLIMLSIEPSRRPAPTLWAAT